MKPHPYYQAIVDAYAASGRVYFHQSTPEGARAMLKASMALAPPPTDLPVLAEVADGTIDGPHGPIPIRRYVPEGAHGTCVYYHSGGWVIGDLDFADATCRRLAGLSGAEIVSVDYRLAPEHPYPQPLDDAWAALVWAATARTSPLVVIGESAGGNLAAACAIRARDEGGPEVAGLLLAYPATDHAMDTASYRDIGPMNWLLSANDMAWFWDHYAPAGIDRAHASLSPLRVADAAGLPPTMLCVAELDPLRDEGLAFAEKLAAAGVPVVTRCDAGMLHGYFGGAGAVPLAAEAVRAAAAWIAGRMRAAG